MSDEGLRRLAKAIVDEVFPEKERLQVGMVCQHPDGRTVKIVDGQFWGRYGVSNFWSWRAIKEDGDLGPLESGYGWSI